MAKFKQKDIQEAVNIKREDESRNKIKECKDEIEKVLQKFGCSIYPVLQMIDTQYQDAMKKELEKPAEKL